MSEHTVTMENILVTSGPRAGRSGPLVVMVCTCGERSGAIRSSHDRVMWRKNHLRQHDSEETTDE